MPKTIAITPSWYWPAAVPRVVGVPPFGLHEILVDRRARREPDAPALIAPDARLTNREMAEQVAAAAADPAPTPELLAGPPSAAAVVQFLGAIAAGRPLRLPDGLAGTEQRTGLVDPLVGVAAPDGSVAWHSHRSLLAGAVSVGAFLQVGPERPWLTTFPLASWEGVYGVATGLASGAPLVLAANGEAALEAVAREGCGWAFMDLTAAFNATREAKRDVKSIRGVLSGLVLSVPGLFDADQRRRVSRLFECPALTLYGRAETGPIFAAHPSWYIDEAVGIPITNAHVVPVDPRSLVPVATLWELVESAMVTVFSPMTMAGYEGEAHAERFRDGRFVTGVIASSDANGMIYLLPD